MCFCVSARQTNLLNRLLARLKALGKPAWHDEQDTLLALSVYAKVGHDAPAASDTPGAVVFAVCSGSLAAHGRQTDDIFLWTLLSPTSLDAFDPVDAHSSAFRDLHLRHARDSFVPSDLGHQPPSPFDSSTHGALCDMDVTCL